MGTPNKISRFVVSKITTSVTKLKSASLIINYGSHIMIYYDNFLQKLYKKSLACIIKKNSLGPRNIGFFGQMCVCPCMDLFWCLGVCGALHLTPSPRFSFSFPALKFSDSTKIIAKKRPFFGLYNEYCQEAEKEKGWTW